MASQSVGANAIKGSHHAFKRPTRFGAGFAHDSFSSVRYGR